MAEPTVRINAVREVALATRTAVVDPAGEPPPTLALVVAESLRHWLAAATVACVAAAATFVALDPATARRTGTLLLRGPTERVETVGTPADLARFVGSVGARTESGEPVDFSVRSERGSDLATLVIGLSPKEGAAGASARAQRVVDAANASLSEALERTQAGIAASFANASRSAAETEAILRSIVSTNPQSEAISGLMQQVHALREEMSKLEARAAGFRGIRVVGDADVSAGRSASMRSLAAAAAALAALVVTPLVLRFARQVADARRAIHAAQAP